MYSRSAISGDAKAQFNIGMMYANGEGVSKSDINAVTWLTKAAEQDYAGAQYSLGRLYSHGYGERTFTPLKVGPLKDRVKAKYWIKKAYENQYASPEIKELAEHIWNTLKLWEY